MLAFAVATPVLWVLGLLIPVGALLLLWLLFRSRFPEIAMDKIAAVWCLVGVAQAISVAINWYRLDLPSGELLYRLTSTGVSGWLFLGAAFGVGKYYSLASRRIVRAVAIMGTYILGIGVLSILLRIALNAPSLEVETPIAKMLPSTLPAREFYFTMHFYTTEDILGTTFPRLILFYPWPVMLGVMGLAVFFISLHEPSRRWRLLGCLGGTLGVFGSLSRVAIVCFTLGLFLYSMARFPRKYVFLFLSIAFASFALLIVANPYGWDFVRGLYDSLVEVRTGSSTARALGYEASLEGFLASPIIGHGWPGDYVAEGIPMTIGSHSSVFGLLYTGGVLTFGMYCFAFGMSLVALFLGSISGSAEKKAALAIMVCLAVASLVESTYSYVLPLLIVFFFIGGTFKHSQSHTRAINAGRIV